MNAKVDRYYAFYVESDSGAGTDAFTYNGGGSKFFYVFPPFSIIPLLLRKIECENAEGVRIKKLYISLT